MSFSTNCTAKHQYEDVLNSIHLYVEDRSHPNFYYYVSLIFYIISDTIKIIKICDITQYMLLSSTES